MSAHKTTRSPVHYEPAGLRPRPGGAVGLPRDSSGVAVGALSGVELTVGVEVGVGVSLCSGMCCGGDCGSRGTGSECSSRGATPGNCNLAGTLVGLKTEVSTSPIASTQMPHSVYPQ